MNILINGDKIDFELENEKNANEIITGIARWLSSKCNIIQSIVINNKPYYSTQNKELENINISEIKTIEIETILQRDYALFSLIELLEYLKKIENYIEDNTLYEQSEALTDGINWIKKILTDSLQILNIDNTLLFYEKKPLAIIMKEYEIAIFNLKLSENEKSNFETLKSLNTAIYKSIEKLIKIARLKVFEDKIKFIEADTINTIFEEALEIMQIITAMLQDIAENIQRGKDFEAMIEIKEIANSFNNIIYLVDQARKIFNLDYTNMFYENTAVDQYYQEFLKILKNIVETFENQDFILLSDIIEYELIEKLSDFKNAVDFLKSEIQKLSTKN